MWGCDRVGCVEGNIKEKPPEVIPEMVGASVIKSLDYWTWIGVT